MINARSNTLIVMIFCAAAARLIPHPPNFTPLGAIALFGGAYFTSKRAAFAIPLAAMFLSNAALGLMKYGYKVVPLLPWVYASFVLIVCLGLLLRGRKSPAKVATAALTSSVLFFAITNFGVWLGSARYPQTPGGLLACYVAALPFFQNTLLGDAVYTTVLFGGFALAQKYCSSLREPAPLSAVQQPALL